MTTTVNKERGKTLTLGPKGQTMELEVPLTPEHLQALERQIADVSSETFRLEEEKKRVTQPINEQIKAAKTRERDLVARRERGVMLAQVPVETHADPYRKEKWIVRLDTGEIVQDSLRATTDDDLQALLPGIVVEGDNRPDAPVFNLFTQKQETEAPRTETTWSKAAPAPYADWHLSESNDKGQRLYMITWSPAGNPHREWGPFGYTKDEGFHPADDKSATLGDRVRANMAAALGLVAQYDVNGHGRYEAHETDEFERFLGTLEAMLGARLDELEAAPKVSSPLRLYQAAGHPGWAAYVDAGQLFIRPPNVDSFEPARSPKDFGPLEWNKDGTQFDGVVGANVTSAWLSEHDRLIEEFDLMKRSGKMTEPINEFAPPKKPMEDEEEDGDSAEAQSPTPAQATLTAAELADKVTDNGRKLLKALVQSGINTASRLGSLSACAKPGAALKHLAKGGLVELTSPGEESLDDAWGITPLGREVYALLYPPGK